jgi:hypothetical protein
MAMMHVSVLYCTVLYHCTVSPRIKDLTKVTTKFIEQSLSGEVNGRSASQEMLQFSCNLNIRNRVNKSSLA